MRSTTRNFWLSGKLTMPVLAIGGEKIFGRASPTRSALPPTMFVALSIPNSGHWLMEEQPEATINAILSFLAETNGP